MQNHLVVFGDKTANEVVETARIAYGDRYASVERVYYIKSTFRHEVLPRYASRSGTIHYIIGIADIELKQEIADRMLQTEWIPQSVIHPTACIAPSASLGAGVFVGPLAVLSTHARVGDHCIIHLHSSVGHDAVIGDYCAILPGARISGNVRVGARSLIGSNAFINAGVHVGDDCQVDALTYVSRDLESKQLLSVRTKKPLPRIMSKGKTQ